MTVPAPVIHTNQDYQSASVPPEARGLRRDAAQMMVTSPTGLTDARFRELPRFLHPGDLLVVNTSPTMAGAIPGRRGGENLTVHFSTPLGRDHWVVELRRADASGPILDASPGDVIAIPGGRLFLDEAADGALTGGVRLWRTRIETDSIVRALMQAHGSPIRYGYTAGQWPLSAYQTMFADQRRWPGSAEMPSAGRPFTSRLVRALRRRSVSLAAIELHAGVSSLESHEPPQPERFTVSPRTAAAVNATRQRGRRVVAVGTTVTRALETAASEAGEVTAMAGWTDLVIGSDAKTRAVDGLITGWHPPEASHLDLLRAVAGADLVTAAYHRARSSGYLWHEFGDSCLLLADREDR